jgi:hypothetical protein
MPPYPAFTPLEFMLGMMADPNVDPSLRFKAAQAVAPFVHPKPTGAPAPESGPAIIDVHRAADDAALVAESSDSRICNRGRSLPRVLWRSRPYRGLGSVPR